MSGDDAAPTHCCSLCVCLFDSKHSLTAHLVVEHMQWIRFKCAMCSFVYLPTETALTQHFSSTHKGMTPKAIYFCDVTKSDELDSLLDASKLLSQQMGKKRSTQKSAELAPYETDGTTTDLISDSGEKAVNGKLEIREEENIFDGRSEFNDTPSIFRTQNRVDSTNTIKTTRSRSRNSHHRVSTPNDSPTTRQRPQQTARPVRTDVSLHALPPPADDDCKTAISASITIEGADVGSAKERRTQEPKTGSASRAKEPQFGCAWPDCATLCHTRRALLRHLLTHTGETPFKCTWKGCERGFTRKENLRLHHLLMHSGTTGTLACTWAECETRWSDRRQLHRHILTAHRAPGGSLHCPWTDCTHGFSRMAHLQRHLLTHTYERPFKCAMTNCKVAFTRKTNLEKHLERHRGDQTSFTCTWPHCRRYFIGVDDLQRHVRTVHTGERPFGCAWPDCRKRYPDGRDLRRHIQGHTGYTCQRCRIKFKLQHSLNRHEQTCVADGSSRS